MAEPAASGDGAGAPVVFLHGWGGSAAATWEATGIPARMRAAGRRVVVPDLPGHGIAARVGGGASHDPAAYADIVGQVLDALPDGGVDLVGYSLGAKIALCIAARAPERVRRIVAVAVGDNIFAAEASGSRLGALLAHGIAADAPDRLRRMAVYAFQSGGDPLALAACLNRPWDSPSAAALGRIRAPVLLALAEHDELVQSSERLAACLPECRVHMLTGQDHLSAPYTAGLGRLIDEFLP